MLKYHISDTEREREGVSRSVPDIELPRCIVINILNIDLVCSCCSFVYVSVRTKFPALSETLFSSSTAAAVFMHYADRFMNVLKSIFKVT
jgi:hypothetical protein